MTEKRDKEPSVEAGLAMATILGLGGHGRSKSDDATGSDDDDAASSSRQDAGSDVEDVASDGIKVPGKPGRKKKRDGEAGGDKDEDGDEKMKKSACKTQAIFRVLICFTSKCQLFRLVLSRTCRMHR